MKPKFRAWQKYHKKMLKVKEIEFNKDVNIEAITVWNPPNTIPFTNTYIKDTDFDIEVLILMQGWESEYQPELTIYKGDIINVHWFYANHDPETLGVYEDEVNLECVEIIEVRGVLGFYVEDDFLPLAFVPTHEESFEVIGNIYEADWEE